MNLKDVLTAIGIIASTLLIYYTIKKLFPWFKTEFSYNLWPGVFAQIVELGLFVFSFDAEPTWKIIMLVSSIVILIAVTLFNIAQTKISAGILATFAEMLVAAGIVLVIIVMIILLTPERKKKKHN